jgi:uncharacterized protein (TIGR00266 family)
MNFEIRQKPDFAIARIQFDQPGETFLVEASAMVAHEGNLQMTTDMQGGLLGAAKRKLMGGESVFQNTFTCTAPGQTLWVAPGPDGDMESLVLDGSYELMMSSGAFIASVPSVTLDTKWGGAKGFFSGKGLFLLKASGLGPIFFSSYGGIHAIDVGPDGYICDTGHIVAFTSGLQYDVRKLGGLKSLFMSGEGLVCEFRGQGRLWIATRNPMGLASFLAPFRPKKSN